MYSFDFFALLILTLSETFFHISCEWVCVNISSETYFLKYKTLFDSNSFFFPMYSFALRANEYMGKTHHLNIPANRPIGLEVGP